MGETKEMVSHLNSENERLIDEITQLQNTTGRLIDQNAHLTNSNLSLIKKMSILIKQIMSSSGHSNSDEELDLSLQDALTILQVKVREAQFMQQRNHELEKMIEERDEEIIELMRDNERYQERVEQQPLPSPREHRLNSQLTLINEESSSVD